ncbi:neuropeptide CCHamide-2 [Phymastichus coffea]|uniref:neuropeptide CCHamide-2 n=1 Tax=Phymastichus coffea TaxID=108790 RepID=UPI00273AA3F2|nr:neuropeptide CCHamide-2 [Phymastichus coffea]
MKAVMVASKSRSSAIFWAILFVAFFGAGISAKRGCSAFGHSCYGGHGKRSNPETADIEILPRNAKDEGRIDYDIGHANGEKVLLVPSQGYNRQDQRLINSLHDRPNFNVWSLLVRKLLLPMNRQYKTYEEIE